MNNVRLVSDRSPDGHGEDYNRDHITEPTAVQRRGHLSTNERGQEMVSDSGGDNAADDGPRPLESGREDNRPPLSLVADLGERNHDSGGEQGFHEPLSRGQAAKEFNGHRVTRPTPQPVRTEGTGGGEGCVSKG